MNGFPNTQRPVVQRPGRENEFDKTLVRIILQCMNEQKRAEFISHLMDYAPDIEVKLYEFAKAMMRSWAGKTDLTKEDAAVIEDCRKICDVMGWVPTKEGMAY